MSACAACRLSSALMKWVEDCGLALSVHLSLRHARSHLISHDATDLEETKLDGTMCHCSLVAY